MSFANTPTEIVQCRYCGIEQDIKDVKLAGDIVEIPLKAKRKMAQMISFTCPECGKVSPSIRKVYSL